VFLKNKIQHNGDYVVVILQNYNVMQYLLYYSLIVIILQYNFLSVVNFFDCYEERLCLKKKVGVYNAPKLDLWINILIKGLFFDVF